MTPREGSGEKGWSELVFQPARMPGDKVREAGCLGSFSGLPLEAGSLDGNHDEVSPPLPSRAFPLCPAGPLDGWKG